jgi:hypothetical protein
LEGQLGTTFVNMEEILLSVVSASLIRAFSNPANQSFSSVLVLVRQVVVSVKEITRYRDVASAFEVTPWKLQLIDFAGLTSPLASWKRKCL